MGEGAFQSLAAQPQQALAARAANASTIAVDRVACLGILLPVASAAIGFGDVTADADRFEIDERLIAVIALVADDLFDPRRRAPTVSTCSAASISVSMLVVVSPSSASCTVTATTAPVSRSTACSALCAKCVRPSFIFVIFASGSCGCVQSSFEPFFFRFRSRRAKSARVGVSMPDACASCVRKS